MQVNDLRSELDKVDSALISYLSKRAKIVKQIGRVKKDLNLPPLDPKRWQQVLTTRRQWGSELGLDPLFIEHIFETIHNYSLQIEEQV